MELELLTTPEAAKLLRLKTQTLNKMRVEGRGPEFLKLGRKVVYKPADLSAWAESGRRKSTSDRG